MLRYDILIEGNAKNYHEKEKPLPILRDIERPLELQMGVVIVVHESGESGVMASGQHA